MSENIFFYNASAGRVSLSRLLAEIADFVQSDKESYYRLVIGSDSQIKRTGGFAQTDFVTAIVIHRQGKGARYFWQKEKIMRAPALREKIYTETLRSLKVAHQIVPQIRDVISSSKYDLEIHIDVGPTGATREMIKEVVGMVNGNGFVAKTKPESWGASSVADKHT